MARRVTAVALLGLALACSKDNPLHGLSTSGSASGSDNGSAATGSSTTLGSTTDSGGGSTTGLDCPMGCLDADGDGYGRGDACAGPDCDDDNPARFDGCYYIAPGGNDDNAGTEDAPWGTFAQAIAQLQPGDSLVLLDGQYELASTGMLEIDCANGAMSGTGPDQPISVRARNDRAAYLVSDGSVEAVHVNACQWWVLSGLAGRSGDLGSGIQGIVDLADSLNVTVRRALFSHANRYTNSAIYHVAGCTDVVIEDSEAYYFHRRAFTDYLSQRTRFRRCYANSRGYPDLDGAVLGDDGDRLTPWGSSQPAYGDLGFEMLLTTETAVENCVTDGPVRLAYRLAAGTGYRVEGSIALDPDWGVHLAPDGGQYPIGHTVHDVVVARPAQNGVYVRTTPFATADHVTVFDGASNGVRADELGGTSCADVTQCIVNAADFAALRNAGVGIEITAPVDAVFGTSNAFGNPQNDYAPAEPIDDNMGQFVGSWSVDAPRIGLGQDQCAVFIPQDSTMHGLGNNGGDIGANVLYRVVDGAPTDQPLWDPETGAFPCGAIVAGINDVPGSSCRDVHERLNVQSNGCTLPSDYPTAPACP